MANKYIKKFLNSLVTIKMNIKSTMRYHYTSTRIPKIDNKENSNRSSHCSTVGWVASWELWDAGSIPSPVQWVKDPLLLPPWCTLQIQFGFSPWPVIFYVAQVQPEKKKSLEGSLI